MVLGISLGNYTLLHVVISVIGIGGSGFVVMYGFLKGKPLNGWSATFLTTTALTSITGFGFDHSLSRTRWKMSASTVTLNCRVSANNYALANILTPILEGTGTSGALDAVILAKEGETQLADEMPLTNCGVAFPC
ncbi:MAG TPA: hypothetical protein VGV15_01140 [Terriglobales bacterium]|nr:hypothetical protein [Terriglobales bacterium]